MKKLVLITIVALALGACSNPIVKQAVPSLDHCEHVKYERRGINATIEAECQI
jgi:hypothetical protein